MIWDDFILYIQEQGCFLLDETDWGRPIYASRNGGVALLDLEVPEPLSLPTIIQACELLRIGLPPEVTDLESVGLIEEEL